MRHVRNSIGFAQPLEWRQLAAERGGRSKVLDHTRADYFRSYARDYPCRSRTRLNLRHLTLNARDIELGFKAFSCIFRALG